MPNDAIHHSANLDPRQLPQEVHHQEFRTVPWFILRERDIKSKGTALVLSTLWAAAKKDNRTITISNEEIAKRSGICGGAQAALKHLQKLENLKYIERKGNHKNRIIRMLFSIPEGTDLRGLTIPPDIFCLNISPTKKIALSIVEAFPNMSKSEICRRLGMTKRQLNRTLQNIQPYKESPSNPIKKAPQPYKKSPPSRGEVGSSGVVQLLSKDSNKGASPPATNLISLNRGDNTMIQPTHPGIGTCRHRPQKNSSDPYARLTSSPTKTIPIIPFPEIEEVWKSFPNNAKHQPGKKAYELAKATISQLRRSPRIGLSSGQVERLVSRMTKDPRNKFTLKQINEFLDHKFSPEERKLIYSRLSKLHDKAYGGFTGTASLSDALCNINGYSEIMLVWYYPPKPKRVSLIKVSPTLEKVADMVMEVVNDQSYATMNKVRSIVKNLHMIYEKETRPRMTDETKYHYGDFKRFMIGFIDFVVEKYGSDLYPGHFRSGSDPKSIFQQWIRVMKNSTNASIETSDYLAELQQEL